MMDGIQGSSLQIQSALGSRAGAELEHAKRAAQDGDEAKLTREFGKLFAQQLVKEMRQSVEGGFFGSGSGADIYASWFDEHLAEVLAKDDALGMAGMIKASMPRGEPVAEAAGGAVILGLPQDSEDAEGSR